MDHSLGTMPSHQICFLLLRLLLCQSVTLSSPVDIVCFCLNPLFYFVMDRVSIIGPGRTIPLRPYNPTPGPFSSILGPIATKHHFQLSSKERERLHYFWWINDSGDKCELERLSPGRVNCGQCLLLVTTGKFDVLANATVMRGKTAGLHTDNGRKDRAVRDNGT